MYFRRKRNFRIIQKHLQKESNIYQLMIGIHPANLLMISNKDMNEEELEVSRADFIREHLPTIH